MSDSYGTSKMRGFYDFLAIACWTTFCFFLVIVVCGVLIGTAIKECPK